MMVGERVSNPGLSPDSRAKNEKRNERVKSNGRLVLVSARLTTFTHPAYQPGSLPGPFGES